MLLSCSSLVHCTAAHARILTLIACSADPSADPSVDPSADPSADSSADPSVDPSVDPSAEPSADPSVLCFIFEICAALHS